LHIQWQILIAIKTQLNIKKPLYIMKHFTLSIAFCLLAIPAFCTIHIVTTPGFDFSPMTLTIQEGDTVMFNIDGIHNVQEVSQTTWNNNQSTPLPGGFSLPFGGGMLLPADLDAGTHFYVCQPHANQGMKGTIIVEPSTATEFELNDSSLSIYPNPSTGNVQLSVNRPDNTNNYNIYVYNLEGEEVYATTHSAAEFKVDVDLGHLPKGVYIVRFNEKTGSYSKRLVLQ
jgi:plastocyanin